MKLLIVIHSLASGGAERVATNLANYWSKKKWDTTVATMASGEANYFQLDYSVQYISLDLASDSRNVLDALVKNANRVFALRRLLLTIQPDIVVAMMNTTCVHLALAAIRLPIKCIGAEREHPSMSRVGRIWSFLRRVTYGRLDAVVALTNEGAQWLISNTWAKRVSVIPNAVVWPLPEYPPRIDPDTVGVSSRKRLLAMGRLDSVKGFDMLLDAYIQLEQQHSDWELVIVGEGGDRDALQNRIDSAHLSDKAMLVGQVGNPSDWYRSAHLFVLSSRHEGFPNVLVEAMAHGLPVVSFDCEAGPRNIISHEKDGLLVPAGDTTALVAALDRMMSNSRLRDAIAFQAAGIRHRLSEEHIQSLWAQLFRDLMSE